MDNNYLETHYCVVSTMTEFIEDGYINIIEYYNNTGMVGLFELAKSLTDEFQNIHKDREWDGEFFDEIYLFTTTKLNNLDYGY